MSAVLSDEQMAIVHAGTQRRVSWEPVAMPTGRQVIPQWCRGLHVDFGFGHAGAPAYRLKVLGDVYAWPEQTWAKEGKSCYITRHDDGRARVYYHDGAISEASAWRIVEDGPPPEGYEALGVNWGMTPEESRRHQQQDARRAWQNRWHFVEPERGKNLIELGQASAAKDLVWLRERRIFGDTARIEVRAVTATTKQDGFAGAIIWTPMANGELRALRGPWHGGAPAGYVEVTTCDWLEYGNERLTAQREIAMPWQQRSSCAGLYIAQDLFIRLIAHFAPHVQLLRVEHSYGTRIEAADPRWGGVPKAVIYEQERMRAVRKEPASRWWRMYWDGRGGYCGSLRMPSYGWEDDVTDRTTPEEVERLKPRWG